MAECWWLLGFFTWIGLLSYHTASKPVVLIGLTVYLAVASLGLPWSIWQISLLWAVYGGLAILFGYPSLRRFVLTRYFFYRARRKLSTINELQQESKSARTQTAWIDELFSGSPDWSRLFNEPRPPLSTEEALFLSGPVDQLIRQIEPWHTAHPRHDLPTKVWQYVKREGFFGLLIPTDYEGHGFSYYGVMAILQKIAGASDVLAHMISLANALSPSQLILHGGSKAQRQYHLPRFAKGESMACLGLMNSNTLGMIHSTDRATVCYGQFRGENVLGLRVTWQKQLVPFAPMANEIAVLVHMRDPQNLCHQDVDQGLSWILIPTHLAGIQIGRRHIPLDGVMPIGPCSGQDVFVPLDYRIGEEKDLGKTLLESAFKVYHAITSPACQAGRSKAIAAYTGAYARICQHHHQPFFNHPGMIEQLISITGLTYLIDAATHFTVNQMMADHACELIPAITKVQTTELSRQIIHYAMDIQASKAGYLGPSNFIAQAYQRIADDIATATSNNLLQSTVISEKTMAYHPHYTAIQQALKHSDPAIGLENMDQHHASSLWRFSGHQIRTFILSLTHGRSHWHTPPYCRRHFQTLARLSSAYVLLLDVCLKVFGSKLAYTIVNNRLNYCLSQLYLLSAVLRHFADLGQPKDDQPLIDWLFQDLAYRTEQAMVAIVDNLPSRWWRHWLQFIIFPFNPIYKPTTDQHAQALSEFITYPSETRDRLLAGLDLEALAYHPLHEVHHTWKRLMAIQPLLEQMYQGLMAAQHVVGKFEDDLAIAITLGIITDDEADILLAIEAERCRFMGVDDFLAAELSHR